MAQKLTPTLKLEEILEKKGLLEREIILENILKNRKILSISKIVLLSLLAAGVVTMAITAPGALKIFQPFLKKAEAGRVRKTKKILSALKSKKLIEIDFDQKGWVIRLTEKGKEKALKCYLEAFYLKHKQWDKKWRVVIFDIPNKLNRKRDALREFLKEMGFKELQRSIYVFPFPCQKELEALLEYLQLRPYVKFLEADFIDEEEALKTHFKL